MKKIYITTTLPYVNADPHIGFALEIVQADILARLHRARGYDVFFNTGTDEHGAKIYNKALAEGKDPQEYADEYAAKFDNLKIALNLSYDNFIRTTDEHHKMAAREFWKRCEQNGDIEKKLYRIKYCVGCELEKTDSELIDGVCELHPNLKLEDIEEENYFFKFSRYGEKLIELYDNGKNFVVPEHRLNEMRKLVDKGLNDFSISRLKEKMPWGIPVPGDEDHVMYVWFDALVNYVSAIGWPDDMEKFKKWWPVVQLAGKDQVRQQAAMWQAMLMSAGIEPSEQIFIHGFITSGGQKMSKSLGNVIDPFAVVEKYGADAFRYYLARHIHPFEDSDFTDEKFRDAYNADLANGIGNFAARVLTLGEGAGELERMEIDGEVAKKIGETNSRFGELIEGYKFQEAVEAIWELISFGDAHINNKKPWETGDKNTIYSLVAVLDVVSALIFPIMPETSSKITEAISWSGEVLTIKKINPLFPRLVDSI